MSVFFTGCKSINQTVKGGPLHYLSGRVAHGMPLPSKGLIDVHIIKINIQLIFSDTRDVFHIKTKLSGKQKHLLIF